VGGFLQRVGCAVSVAASPSEGLDAIDKQTFDFVVSEWAAAEDDGQSMWEMATDQRPWLRGRFIFCGSAPLPEGPRTSERLLPTPLDLNALWLEMLVVSAWRGRAPL
jgi:hypothetical protein